MYSDYDGSRRLYRSRRGMLFGVCRGLAEYFDFSVGATRLLVFLAFLFTGFFPVGLVYLILAFVMKKEPAYLRYPACAEYVSVTPARLSRRFEGLDQRIQNIETIVTRRGYDWDERLNQA